LGRVWLVALAVLLVGVAEREAGLAAALLSVALFTVYLAGQGIAHVLFAEGDRQ
jgi:putative exporter of polyketide antibiotics